jgi:hypothetical protein
MASLTFQSIVIYTLISLLIVLLVVIGINLHASTKKTKWPPIIGDCPDYWYDGGAGGSKCTVNTDKVNLGSATSPMDFSKVPYSGSNGDCSKYRWSISKGVSWDGITYGVQNPCVTPSTN